MRILLAIILTSVFMIATTKGDWREDWIAKARPLIGEKEKSIKILENGLVSSCGAVKGNEAKQCQSIFKWAIDGRRLEIVQLELLIKLHQDGMSATDLNLLIARNNELNDSTFRAIQQAFNLFPSTDTKGGKK
jgi:hypothetical protein